MLIKESQYIYPPRAENCIPQNQITTYTELGWITQIKFNDTRLLIKYLPDNTYQLWNRHGMKLSYTPPEHLHHQIQNLKTILNMDPTKTTLLDGGLLDTRHPAIKDTIVIWDILVKDDNHLLGTTYKERHDQITQAATQPYYYTPPHKKHDPINVGMKITNDILTPINYHNNDPILWEIVTTANNPYPSSSPILEGCVIKDLEGILEMGYQAKNNTSWMAKSRVKTNRHRF